MQSAHTNWKHIRSVWLTSVCKSPSRALSPPQPLLPASFASTSLWRRMPSNHVPSLLGLAGGREGERGGSEVGQKAARQSLCSCDTPNTDLKYWKMRSRTSKLHQMHLEAQSEILIDVGDSGSAEPVCGEKELVRVSKLLWWHVKQRNH